jgi:haloalkane dehalogenase
VSIVWGGRDFCFHDAFLARWREILPEARITRLADVGHYVLDDGGAEAVTLCRRGVLGA